MIWHGKRESFYFPANITVVCMICNAETAHYFTPCTTFHPMLCSYIRVRDVRTVTFIKRLEAMKKDPRVKGAQVRHASPRHWH